jgi:hypothetical protein
MNKGTMLSLNTDINGAVTISNDRSTITIHPDGTVAVSSYDPIQLTGATLAKLDKSNVDGKTLRAIAEALGQRLEKKTSN